jgi:hypothetical protein
MPKRYRVVRGSPSFTWIYEDTDTKPPSLLAESKERWDTKRAVRDAIKEMKEAEVVEDE